MPKRKRKQREHTEDWQTIQQYTLWPEQTAYELLRPIVLFGDPAIQRAQETGEARNTLERKADSFDEQGMISLFASKPRKQPQETARSLPPDMRQLIVDLRVELPTMSLREIADVCAVRFDRRPSHHTVQLVLASGPPPSVPAKRYQIWEKIADPAERRLAVVRLHAEGWSVSSIAEYPGTSRPTVYATLKRWIAEGIRGLEDKSHVRKAPRVVTLEIANEICKKQENPLIGEWRMHAALLQMGIKVSPRTCGRIMAKHRALYGWEKPKNSDRPKKEMPFKAARRHEYWSIDVRYIEHHQLPDVKGPVYVISILENFSRMLLASIISDKQDTTAYLRVFAMALRNYGAPEAIVTARRVSSNDPRANPGSHLLCHTIYPLSGSIRVYQISPMALLCRSWTRETTRHDPYLHQYAESGVPGHRSGPVHCRMARGQQTHRRTKCTLRLNRKRA